MSSSTQKLSRPGFETVELEIDVDETRDLVEAAVKGLDIADTGEGLTVRTLDGALVAVLGRRQSGSGDEVTALAYRTEPAVQLATRKAAMIHNSVESYVSSD